MEKTAKVFGGLFLALAGIMVFVILGTLFGAISGWIVGLVFGETILRIVSQLGLSGI